MRASTHVRDALEDVAVEGGVTLREQKQKLWFSGERISQKLEVCGEQVTRSGAKAGLPEPRML